MSIDEALEALEASGGNTRFRFLVGICTSFFGDPRIKGSHHIFKMPWAGNPRINLQEDGGQTKPYQVYQVIEALHQLKEQREDNASSSRAT